MQIAPFDLLSADDLAMIQSVMTKIGLWNPSESISDVHAAGDGNMNLVLRVVTNCRRVILKQSRPWVEKYPQIEAPADRILAEIDFYQRVATHGELEGSMPKLLAFDSQLHVMVMEDLGDASDFTGLYESREVRDLPLASATEWLARLHRIRVSSKDAPQVGNRALRQLNHAHMFDIPLRAASAIPLDSVCSGLEDLASDLRADERVCLRVRELGECYLGSGPSLLHGDFYPGSWLDTSDGFRVIDPEFCFAGPPEFDLGVLAAHRVMIGGADESVQAVLNEYLLAGGEALDRTLVSGFAGAEVIRRLIGVAQLPLTAQLDQRADMIQVARSFLL